MKGTQTVPNHRDGVRDVRWGLLFRVAVWVAGILGVVLAALLSAGVKRLFVISDEAGARGVRDERLIDEMRDTRAEAKALRDALERFEREANERFLSKDQYYHDMSPEVRRPAPRR